METLKSRTAPFPPFLVPYRAPHGLPKIIVLTAAHGGRSLTIITTPNVVEKFKNAMSEVRPHQLNTVAAYGRTIDYIHINRWPTTFPACTGMRFCLRSYDGGLRNETTACRRQVHRAGGTVSQGGHGEPWHDESWCTTPGERVPRERERDEPSEAGRGNGRLFPARHPRA